MLVIRIVRRGCEGAWQLIRGVKVSEDPAGNGMLGRERHVPCGSFDSLVPIFGPPSIERAACLGSRELSGRLSVHGRLGTLVVIH